MAHVVTDHGATSSDRSGRRYRLAPGIEIVQLEPERYLLRSDFVACGLSGAAAADLVERALRVLGEPLPFAEIAALLPDYRPEGLLDQLEMLVREGALVHAGDAPQSTSPYAALFDELGLGAGTTSARLAEAKVAVFGLEAHGAHVAELLANAGVGALVLVDPFPFAPAHRSLTPVTDADAIGSPRDEVVAAHVRRHGTVARTSGTGTLDRERVAALTEGCDVAVVCWDRGYGAAMHWSNEAAIEHGVRTLFSELRPTSSLAGPLFVPGRTACWMCTRMRTIACEQDVTLSMAVEQHLDARREPRQAERGVLPVLPVQLATALALETLKMLVRLHQPRLAGQVMEFNAVTGTSTQHSVLVEPSCPVCAARRPRHHPPTAQLLAPTAPGSPPIHQLAETLVSPRSGIVSEFALAGRDATEPPDPQVWRGRLANHRYSPDAEVSHLAVSGKGMTREQAWASCLGEAVERYSGGRWDPEELETCRRDELIGPSIDPYDLVLFRSEQYEDLPYAPYTDDTVLPWMRGRSLVHDEDLWIPAIAVLMEYEVQSREEYLAPVTSNGLAAGPTLTDAVYSAVCEVLERDAFMITWSAQLPGARLDPSTHPDPDVRKIAAGYRRRGVELALFEIATDHPVHVVVGIAFQDPGGDGPCATVGLGASVDQVAAARSAALEVAQVRPAFRARARTHDQERIAELVADPSRTTSLEDHALLYADPAMREAFAFLEGQLAPWQPATGLSSGAALERIVDHFRSTGRELAYVNLTPPDMEALGLFTARAVLPGFQPIWFGSGEARLGGTRLFELGAELGLRDDVLRPSGLNPLPHPIA